VPCGAGVATIIMAPSRAKYRYVAHLIFAPESNKCTNNIAEYEVVILGLCKLRALGIKTCIVRLTPKLSSDKSRKTT
jgi:ribonuclease HI